MSLLADDVAALIEVLGLERPAVAGFSAGGLTATIFGIRHPGVARAIVNDAGYDGLNPRADSFAMMRQMLGGSPEATQADPDAAAAFFAAQPDMAAMFELMTSRPGLRRRARALADLPRAARSSEPPPGPATPSTTWPRSTCRPWCSSETVTTSAPRRKRSPRTDTSTQGQLAILPDTGHAITAAKIELLRDFAAATPLSANTGARWPPRHLSHVTDP